MSSSGKLVATSRGKLVAILASIALLAAGGIVVASSLGEDDGKVPVPEPEETGFVPKKAYLTDACELPPRWVRLIDRGWVSGGKRDHDLVIVPKPPNWIGNFVNTSHSGPYDFLQEIPLVFYGDGFIKPLGRVELEREVTIADVAPTFARLMHFDEWPERVGVALDDVLEDTPESPRLIVTIVIDGGGWNVLERWSERWPNLERLMERGATVENAIVGSSPSITPSVHSNLSTGTFPRFHGVTGITVRADEGFVGAFSEGARVTSAESTVPDVVISKSTVADEWDLANDNRPLVGGLIPGNYPLGFIGIGAAQDGGDHDVVGFVTEMNWTTNTEYYSLPEYVNTELPSPTEYLEEVDRADGEADGLWQGHEVRPIVATPAFAPWILRTAEALLDREGFGDDDLTDLFFMNYKAPDYAGHLWNMIGPEQGDVIQGFDDELPRFVQWLDENVGRDQYVLLITADHGQTPLDSGGWSIRRSETVDDVNRRFDDVDNGEGIIEGTSATSLFLDKDELKANDLRAEQVASFLSRYTISMNVPEGEEIPEEYADRLDERVYSAVFPGDRLPDIVRCTGARD